MSKNEFSRKEFLDPKYSLLSTVQTYCDFANLHSTSNVTDKPIIITHSYIICGEIVAQDKIDGANTEMPLVLSKNFIDKAKELINTLFSKEEASQFNPKVLIMKDVTIRSISSNQITKLQVFNLFVDQIVGYSFGHID